MAAAAGGTHGRTSRAKLLHKHVFRMCLVRFMRLMRLPIQCIALHGALFKGSCPGRPVALSLSLDISLSLKGSCAGRGV